MPPLGATECSALGATVATAVEGARAELVDAVVADLGFPLGDVEGEIRRTRTALRKLSNLAPHLEGRRSAAGPDQQVALLLPFNMGPFAFFVIAAIVAAGNRVLVRLSERAPTLSRVCASVLASALPQDVTFTRCSGRDFVAQAVGSDSLPVLVAYGGEELGRELLRTVAPTKIIFEGPGKDSMLVGAGADPARVAGLVSSAAFRRSGQECTSTERLILPEDAAETVDAVVDAVRQLPAAPTWEPTSAVTPLISDRAASTIAEQLLEARSRGARVVVGGQVDGRYVTPTVVVDVPRDCSLWLDETFGPVVAVRSEVSWRDRIEAATEGRYGLHGIVVGAPEAIPELVGPGHPVEVEHLAFGKVGTVSVDRVPFSSSLDDFRPFGGWGISGWIRDPDGALRQGPRLLAREVTW